MFSSLRTAVGGTREKQPCDRSNAAKSKDLLDKTGDLVSDLKISPDLRRNIYALEVQTNTFFSNNSELTVLEKDTTLLFCFQGFLGKARFDGSGGKSSVLS